MLRSCLTAGTLIAALNLVRVRAWLLRISHTESSDGIRPTATTKSVSNIPYPLTSRFVAGDRLKLPRFQPGEIPRKSD